MSADEEAIRKEVFELLEDHLDGSLSGEGRARLNELFQSSAEVRRVYLEESIIESILAGGEDASSWGGKKEPFVKSPWVYLSAFGVALIALVGLAFLWMPSTARRGEPVGVVEYGDGERIRTGDDLFPGEMPVGASGIQFRMDGGARVLMEGAGQLEVLDSETLSLEMGRIRAVLDDAKSTITVKTRMFEVEDLGTEFGIAYDPEGDAEIHVLDGKVRALFDGVPREVGAGNGLRWRGGSFEEEIEARPDQFSSFKSSPERHARWREALETLIRDDATLLAAYDFEELKSGLIDVTGNGHDGKIVGAVSSVGRWPQKGALEISDPSGRVEINVPGQHEHLTLAAWVRIDPLTDAYRVVLSSEKDGERHIRWHVRRSGSLTLDIREKKGEWSSSKAEGSIPSSQLGAWRHVATTYDGAAGVVRLYRNGELVAEHEVARGHLEIGRAQIGSWDGGASRPLGGVIDEVIIWGSVLESGEIRSLFESGRP